MNTLKFAESALIVLAAPIGILLALAFIRIYGFIKSLIEEAGLEAPPPSNFCPLSSLKVGQCFTIPGDEYDLWEVTYFGMQGVRVWAVGNNNKREWLKYDLPVKIFPTHG